MVPYGQAVIINHSSCVGNKKMSLCAEMWGRGASNMSWNPLGGKKKWSQNVVNPFFLTPGPLIAEQEAGGHHMLAFPFLYDCGHSAFSTRHVDCRPCAFHIDFGGDTVWRAGRQACIWWKSNGRL